MLAVLLALFATAVSVPSPARSDAVAGGGYDYYAGTGQSFVRGNSL
jgi:hypothetical protein